MKSFKNVIVPVMAFFVMGLTSCSNNEDAATYSANALKNTELMNILKQKGYQFDKDGKLELNDLANNTTSLDLSGTKLKDISGLDIFPNLKEVKLSNNGYGPVFDFNKLPKQITSVDLTGNKIYDFEGLVNAKLENDELKTTVLHNFTKLYLPATAKYNVEDLMPFYKEKGKEADIQIADADGKLQKYNTIRNIPDPVFRSYIKKIYPSMFIDDSNIDFSKQPSLSDNGKNITLYMPNDIKGLESIEGFEYFVNNPYLQKMVVAAMGEGSYKIGHLMPRENIKGLMLSNTEIEEGIDLSKAKNLGNLTISKCSSITTLDLSQTKICNQEIKDFDVFVSNCLNITHCPNLEAIIFPNPSTDCIANIILGDLPKLKKVDLSMIKATEEIALFLDNTEIKYPELKNYFSSAENKKKELTTDQEKVSVTVSKKMLDTDSFKEFIKKYGKYCNDRYMSYQKEFDAGNWLKPSDIEE